jgi:glycerophosphoryl diester phosphodiesterase
LRSPHILVHGHRGARARRPENTLAGFRYAIEAGVDALELDVAVTQDDIVVVCHDPHINAEICCGPHVRSAVRTLTLAELKQLDCGGRQNPAFPEQLTVPGACIPTLDEVFELSTGDDTSSRTIQFNVEAKIFSGYPDLTPEPEAFARLILECVRRHGLDSRVIVQCFDPRILWAMRTLEPAIPRAALLEETDRDWLDVAREFEATLFSPEYHLVTPERVAVAHNAGLKVMSWTVNKPEDWERLVDAGVDAIISDDPAYLISWLREKGLR